VEVVVDVVVKEKKARAKKVKEVVDGVSVSVEKKARVKKVKEVVDGVEVVGVSSVCVCDSVSESGSGSCLSSSNKNISSDKVVKGKGRPKKEKKETETNAAIDDLFANLVSKSEEEKVDVVNKIEFQGTTYLRSKNTGIIYNMGQECIGKWNENTSTIDFDEEEEEEYEE
jgi:hypothetical protein